MNRDLRKPQALSTLGGITLGPGLLHTLPSAEHGLEAAAHFLGWARVQRARHKAADGTEAARSPDLLETSNKGKHKPSSYAQQ